MTMRDILDDLDAGRKQANPLKAAQDAMRTPLPKRFYKQAGIAECDGGHAVQLDGKQVMTPGRRPLVFPTAAAAGLIAAEFDAQTEVINPMTMPATRLANTSIDGVADDPQAVLEDVLRYSSSDLTCYRAESPEELVRRQAEAWDPVLDWARSAMGARFILAEGVMPVEQPRETIAVVGAHLNQRKEPLRIAALHVMTSLTGSALLAMAVEAGEIDVDTAWAAAHVDEDWNIDLWGEDAEAAAMRAARYSEMSAAAAMIAALDSTD